MHLLLHMVATQYYLIIQELIEVSMHALQMKVILLPVISNALNISVNTEKAVSGRLLYYLIPYTLHYLIKCNDGISFKIK